MPVMRIGCGRAEITPPTGTPLSGFIARENKPSTRVEDALFVRVLVVETEGSCSFLLNYEVLGLKADLEERICSALENRLGAFFSRRRCVITTTHTHSAPIAAALEGEPDPAPAFVDLLCSRAADAAEQALAQRRPAVLYAASQEIQGLTYNRRALLADGRVSIAYEPDGPVLERGPLDSTLTLLAWKDAEDPTQVLAAAVHFACHGVALMTPAISSDIPGQISLFMEQQLGAPCLFLQGASGDVNPTAVAGERPAMLAWCRQLFDQVRDLPARLEPVPGEPFCAAAEDLPLAFQPLPSRAVAEQVLARLEQAAGMADETGSLPNAVEMADMINARPGDLPDWGQSAHIARALANAERRVLRAIDAGGLPEPCPLRLAAWRMGDLVLVFAAAELFTVTGQSVAAIDPSRRILLVTHAAPVTGYIPDADSVHKGGYEASEAWRYYRQPAAFAVDSEAQIVETAARLVKSLL